MSVTYITKTLSPPTKAPTSIVKEYQKDVSVEGREVVHCNNSSIAFLQCYCLPPETIRPMFSFSQCTKEDLAYRL